MIEYRPFRNTDPPDLVDIWRSQPRERGLTQPMSVELFEQSILAKPYFDRAGLIVAADGDMLVGFAHAGFGARDDEQGLSNVWGTTYLVMVRANYQRQGIGSRLLAESEAYLKSRGAQVLYAGGIRPLNAFYLGLYGGSEMPGVLDSTPEAQQLFKSHGYREIDRTHVLNLELSRFRPVVDRTQMQIRRSTQLVETHDPRTNTWWEACTFGGFERTRFELTAKDDGRKLSTVTFWTMQSLSANWGVQAAGLIELATIETEQRHGFATFLLGEALKRQQSQGVSLIEAQTMAHNTAALNLYRKLGFHEVDQGVVFRKQSD